MVHFGQLPGPAPDPVDGLVALTALGRLAIGVGAALLPVASPRRGRRRGWRQVAHGYMLRGFGRLARSLRPRHVHPIVRRTIHLRRGADS